MPAARSPVQHYLDELHALFQEERGGTVADYIPVLAEADPEWFGIAVATTDGQVYEVGDTRRGFSIQSMSKPFTYGLALQDRGIPAVEEKIGVEPSGDAFNEISLAPDTGRPLNPMINAGAMTATSLVAGSTPEARLNHILRTFGRYAGHPLSVDERVYTSEHDTGHRNRAIGHMLRTFDILTEDPEVPLDLYFQQCSITVNCRDLALMAATLADAGINPVTGEQALERDLVDRVLSVMTTCGMYDGAGDWVVGVGMPAKSGVSGGVFAVLPGQLGIAVYSPPLDQHGNSVRGVSVCRKLSSDLGLHFLNVARSSRSALRSQHNVSEMPSTMRRTDEAHTVLDRIGDRAVIDALQGDLLFSGAEAVLRDLVARSDALDVVILDLREVTHIDRPAAIAIAEMAAELDSLEKALVFVDGHKHEALRHALDRLAPDTLHFADLDEAIEWAEDRLLEADGTVPNLPEMCVLREHTLLVDLTDDEYARVVPLLERREFEAGDVLLHRGDPASEILLVTRGHVSVIVPAPDGGWRRLSTISAGLVLGEAAALAGVSRIADARADRPGEFYMLSSQVLDALDESDPALKNALLRALLRCTHDTLSGMSRNLPRR